ncbi:MAG: IPT/TIG domain-containing protein [Blastocatellia bacterium]|nr:IPT/TIG domain-containing protein [Blastocatellia bacterium]
MRPSRLPAPRLCTPIFDIRIWVFLLFLTVGYSPAFAQSASITSISPNQTDLGVAPAKVVIKGSGFVAGSKILFNTTEVSGKIKASGAKIVIKSFPTGLFDNTGQLRVTVVAPSGQPSNGVIFSVGSQNSINVTQPAMPVVNTQSTAQIRATVVDKDGKPISNAAITYTSETPNLATVDNTGLVRGVAAGAATIRLTSSGTQRRVTFAVTQIIDAVSSGIFGDGDIKVDGTTGTVYASDLKNHTLRNGGIGQALGNFAGANGVPGDADGSLATTRFNGPLGIGFGTKSLLIADTANKTIRRIDLTSGRSETIINLADVTAASGVTDWGPRGIAQNSEGAMFISDARNHVIWQARLNGVQVSINVLAGGLGQPGLRDEIGAAARFNTPQEVEINGNVLVVSDRINKVVRLVALPSGLVSTLGRARTSVAEDATRDTFAPKADLTLNDPTGVDADQDGNIYIADGASVRVVTQRGDTTLISELAQPGTFQNAIGVSIVGQTAFVLDAGKGQVIRIGIGAPTAATITPNQVRTGQDAEITVTGSNFLPETKVRLGNQEIVNVTVDSSTRLRFQLPSQNTGGRVPVTISNRGGRVQIPLDVFGPPAAPTNLTVSPVSKNQLNLQWVDNSTDETGFVLERREGTTGTFAPVTTTSPNTIAFQNMGLKSGTTYTFRIKAVSPFGESAYSNEAVGVPGTPVVITFNPAPNNIAVGSTISVAVNFEVDTDAGEQPGTVVLDLPLDPKVVNLAGVTVVPGTLIPTDRGAPYNPPDLVVTPFGDGVRIFLTSAKDPLNAKIDSGKGTFCTLRLPILASAAAGSVSVNVSTTKPFGTQLNRPLVNGGAILPFTSTAASFNVTR